MLRYAQMFGSPHCHRVLFLGGHFPAMNTHRTGGGGDDDCRGCIVPEPKMAHAFGVLGRVVCVWIQKGV